MATSMHDILAMALQSAKTAHDYSAAADALAEHEIEHAEEILALEEMAEVEKPCLQTPAETTVTTVEPTTSPAAQPALATVTVKDLNQKAILVQVKRRMYAPYKRDNEASDDYGAGSVNKHLFKDGNNRVKHVISKYTAVYKHVKQNTVPWSTGIEMLNNAHYMAFSSQLARLMSEAEQAVDDLVANWDAEVQADLTRIAAIDPQLANPSDYPSAQEIRRRFGIEVRYMPVPDPSQFPDDPRLGMSQQDKDSLQAQLDDVSNNANKHVINEMLDVMQKTVSKLSIPIGADNSVFRNSLIDNLIEVSDRMAKVAITDDPNVNQAIKDLRRTAADLSSKREGLRTVQKSRDDAIQSIDSLMQTMQGLV